MPGSSQPPCGDVFFRFWLTLAIVGVPGILGGLTNSISIALKPLSNNEDSARAPRFLFYFAYGITGLGGALAALLAILWANRFPQELIDLQALLMLTCTGYVAGYVANKLLPAIAESFYKKMAQLAEQQVELRKQTVELRKETLKSVGSAVDLSTELTRAKDYLSSGVFTADETNKLIGSLAALARQYPTNRPLNILLSRLWDEAAQNRMRALDALEAFVQAKLGAEERDQDLAAAYWNQANYFDDNFKETKRDEWREKAVESLRKSLTIAPSYRERLLRDPDFDDLVKSDAGRLMLQDEEAPTPVGT